MVQNKPPLSSANKRISPLAGEQYYGACNIAFFTYNIQTLKSAGVHKTVMLTGDTKQVADQVAEEPGVDQVYSQPLPADKVEK